MKDPLNMPPEIKKHPDFNHNVKGFFGMNNHDDTKSNYDRNI
jgi:hypothetical protein